MNYSFPVDSRAPLMIHRPLSAGDRACGGFLGQRAAARGVETE
ncbi:hypothetical protein [Nocardia implantans]|uniref:Uncharacterized protein n=1 Tax=Nocardia implantans TaxID=3108168 RepID=A0ABU6APY5_9NOCA|nr:MULTISPECIES: hypothetical protein [unclassified Nocardia]MEA3526888.1 hypothetical protein [Nocardia sp. CDC192]MEB3509534.1 hypothetical protein [Nocardia sp. CDC186]